MNSHVIPMNEMRGPYVRTGYEAVVASRSDVKYVVTAEEDGVVTLATDNKLSVEYKTLGKKSYSLAEWTSKEEAGTTFPHKQIPNVKKGSKFKKGASLAYDKSFYEPDIFDKTRVIYKAGTTLNIALMETPETFEDSGAIYSKTASRLGTTVIKTKSIRLTNTDKILDVLRAGDHVEPKTPMLSVLDAITSSVSDTLDKRSLEILKDLKMLSPKAGYRGDVIRLQVYYNCEFKSLSPSIKKLVLDTDKELTAKDGHTGEVDSGYSIDGVPMAENELEIKYYIKTTEDHGVADKAVLANQLKFTVGEIYSDPIYTEDGAIVEAKFSTRSIAARIVNSPGLLGTTSSLLEALTTQVTDEYFK